MAIQNKKQFLIKFLICFLICFGGGWLNGLMTQYSVKTWYPTLIKPWWTPPDILFPIAWSLLYLLMALAASLVWTNEKPQKEKALIFFGVQLFLNFLWTWLFFYMQSPSFALVDIMGLWIAILTTIILFFRVSPIASYLLIPYLIWVSYAASLNLFIWYYN